MFTVNETYEFTMLDGGSENSFTGTIEAYEPPLIKLADAPPVKVIVDDNSYIQTAPRPGKIINVTSPHFISAVIYTGN